MSMDGDFTKLGRLANKLAIVRSYASGNGGHTYGDRLSEVERMAVIEYLKTL